MAQQIYARRPIEYCGQQYDRGQLIALANAKNDEKLVRLGYVAEVPRDTVLKECGQCPARFIGDGERNGHAKERHRDFYLSLEEQDDAEDRKEKMLDVVAPLYMDQTKASKDAGLPPEINTARKARAAR